MDKYKICVMTKGGQPSFVDKNSYNDFLIEYHSVVIPRIGESIDIELETSKKNLDGSPIFEYKRYLVMNVIHFYTPKAKMKGATLHVVPI